MFDEITFNRRHANDPLSQMLAERERLYTLADRARSAADEIKFALPEDLRNGKMLVKLPEGPPLSFRSEEDLRPYLNIFRCLVIGISKLRGYDVAESEALFDQNIANRVFEDFRTGLATQKSALEASGCEALYREADALEEQASELGDQMRKTQAISVAGIIAQFQLLRDDGNDDEFLDTIIAGIEQLAAGGAQP